MPELREAVVALCRAVRDMHRYNPVVEAAADLDEAERILAELNPVVGSEPPPNVPVKEPKPKKSGKKK